MRLTWWVLGVIGCGSPGATVEPPVTSNDAQPASLSKPASASETAPRVDLVGELGDEEHEYVMNAMQGVYPQRSGPSGPPGLEVFIGTEGLPKPWHEPLRETAGRMVPCYQKALEHVPDLDGAIEITHLVTVEGRITDVELGGEVHAALARCAIDVLESQKLPPLDGPSEARVKLVLWLVGANG